MKRWIFVMLSISVLAALLTTSCTPTTQRVARAAEPVKASAVSVLVAPARTGAISRVYNYSGDLRPKHSVNILPVAAGRIESLLVEVGDQVKAGDPIAIVESKTYAAQLKQAEANLELARLSLAKMEEGTRPEQIAAAEAAVRFARSAVNDLLNVSDEERTAAAATLAQAEAALKLAQAEYDKVAWAGQVGMLPQSLKLEQATIAYEAARAAYNLQTHPSDVQLSPLMVQLAQAELALALAKNPIPRPISSWRALRSSRRKRLSNWRASKWMRPPSVPHSTAL
jgi:multidrug efflux pump subunit AcrA (membrane-fusion protein)